MKTLEKRIENLETQISLCYLIIICLIIFTIGSWLILDQRTEFHWVWIEYLVTK